MTENILCPICKGDKKILVPCQVCDETGMMAKVPFMICPGNSVYPNPQCGKLFSCDFIRTGKCKQSWDGQNPSFKEIHVLREKHVLVVRVGICVCHKCSDDDEWGKCNCRYVVSKGKIIEGKLYGSMF